MLGLFVLVRKVRDVWEWLNCMHEDTSEGGAVMSRCGFRSVRYLEVKIRCKNALGRGCQCITSIGFSIRD